MPQVRVADRITIENRKKAADAILKGFADSQVATVNSTAATNGYVYGTSYSVEL